MLKPSFPHHRKSILLLAAFSLAVSAHASDFEPPAWAGQAGSEFSEWDVFSTAFGEPGNAPDIAGSTGNAVLRQLTPGAMLTGTMNIYNPAGASSFVVNDSFENPVDVIVFEATVSGTALDVDRVKLEFESDEGTVSLGAAREELKRVSGGFGDTVTSRWTWRLRGREVTAINVKAVALGAHCSLLAARVDVRFKPEPVIETRDEPALDRWSYPFNATPGTRSVASAFVSSDDAGLTRYGMFIFGFDTANSIEPGRGDAAYEIVSAKVTLMTSANFEVVYDPTVDSAFSYLTNGHPQYVDDADAGRPLELFGAGFRNGFTAATWTETAPYAPQDGDRSVYPVTWDEGGQELDASTNVNYAAPYEALPFAAGVIEGVNAGDNVPHETPVAFELDLSQRGVVRYLQNALNGGRLFFTATSLHAGGQGVRTFPEYYTRDSLIGDAPKLEITVRVYDRQEVVTISSIIPVPSGRQLRFPALEGAEYGVRWTTDLKSWQLEREPVLTSPETGVREWLDETEPGSMKFYQVYLKP